jgi:hypothetical protein
MIRKIGAALAIAAGALAVTAIAAPAYAGTPGDGTINAGEVVVWRDANFTGPFWDFSNTQAQYPNDTTGTAKFAGTPATKINDNTSSIANYDAAHYVRAYVNYDFDGAYLQLLPYGVVNGSLSYAYSSLGTTFNENLSSHQVAGP